MPWTKSDVDRHKKGLTDRQKSRWIAIANSVLADTKDEGRAIRIANAKCCESEFSEKPQMSSEFAPPAHMRIVDKLLEGMAEFPQTDQEYLRYAIEAELDAINLYQQLANKTTDPELKKVILDIAKEEKVHVAELETLLKKIDPEYRETQMKGETEVTDKGIKI